MLFLWRSSKRRSRSIFLTVSAGNHNLERYSFPAGWLSPELYLRRPPSYNEQYRLDRMLQAAAARGVEIRIIVYKEVTAALTR